MRADSGVAMSMFVRTVSAYQQMQAWAASQAAFNNQLLGSPGSGVDNSADFTSISSNSFASQADLSGQAALARVQKAVQAASGTGPSTNDPGAAVAQANGQSILSMLGLSTAGVAAAYQSSSPSAPSGPYTAPTNPATGQGYALTSTNAMATLGAVNLLV